MLNKVFIHFESKGEEVVKSLLSIVPIIINNSFFRIEFFFNDLINSIGRLNSFCSFNNIMCLDCIEQVDPPTPELAKSRLILQLLAAGLFILSLFALLAG